MALTLGLVPNALCDVIYYRDPAVNVDALTPDMLKRYGKTGGASWEELPLRNGEKPTKIRYRALTSIERATVFGAIQDVPDGEMADAEQLSMSDRRLLLLLCFRACVMFPDDPILNVREYVRAYHVPMLAEHVVRGLVRKLTDDIWITLGGFVLRASTLEEDQKKSVDSSDALG